MADAADIAKRLTPAARAALLGEGWPERYSDCDRIDRQLETLLAGDYRWSSPPSEEHFTPLGREVVAVLQKAQSEVPK